MPQTEDGQTFVLVPGAWLGGWSWHPLGRLLRARGHQVVALTLPGLSYGSDPRGLRLADAVDFVVAEIERRDLREVVLVGHSWGGYPVTAAAQRVHQRIARVVYYSAAVPERGRSMSDENEQYAEITRRLIAASADGTIALPFEALAATMMQDESPQLQRLVFDLLLPQPGAYMLDAVDVGPVTEAGVPVAYLLGEADIALARPGAEFAARLGVQPVPVPGSHLALVSRPEPLADALVAAGVSTGAGEQSAAQE